MATIKTLQLNLQLLASISQSVRMEESAKRRAPLLQPTHWALQGRKVHVAKLYGWIYTIIKPGLFLCRQLRSDEPYNCTLNATENIHLFNSALASTV